MKNRTATTSASGNRFGMWLGGATIGALAMYFSDPERGRRRRAVTGDKVRRLAVRSGNAMEVAARDLGNRVHGLQARAGKMLRSRPFGKAGEVDDAVLEARIRARIGRAISHAHPVHVSVLRGQASLSGPVLASEKDALLKSVAQVPGVQGVEDRLSVHETAHGIPALQGEAGARLSGAQGNWPPGLRVLGTAGGGILALYGLRRRGMGGTVLGTTGLGLLARCLSNRPLFANGSARQAVHLTKTIHIVAAPEEVFEMWSDYKNFPHFMSQVKEVRDLGGGRSHWSVQGPAGMPIEWDAQLTESRPPHKLAWRTEEGAPVQHQGEVHFEKELTGTRVSVHLSYHPPAGAIGHMVSSLFRGNPKRQMDEDLMRMKSYIESGIPPHDAAQPFPPLGAQTEGTATRPAG